MKNELANLVSDIILHKGKSISIGNRYYYINPPTPYVIARMIKPLSCIEQKNENISDTLTGLSENTKSINKCIALAIIGDVRITPWQKFKLWKIEKRLNRLTELERKQVLEEIMSLIDVSNFFLCAQLANQIVNLTARPR